MAGMRNSALGALTLALLAIGCRSAHEGEVILSRVPNPENNHGNFSGVFAEVISYRGGGATIRASTWVRLTNPDGNIFPDSGGRVFAYSGADPGIVAKWLDARTLKIICPNCSTDNVYLKVTKD